MADPSPADVDEGQKPDVDEGKKPADGEVSADVQEGRQPKTYSEAYVRQLRAEAAESRKKLAEIEQREQEREESEKTELEKERERAAKLEKERDQERTLRLRHEVVAEAGLPPEAFELLTGTTREEMELRAETLGKLLGDKGQKPVASFDGGARRSAPETLPPEQAHNDFLLRALGKEPTRRS